MLGWAGAEAEALELVALAEGADFVTTEDVVRTAVDDETATEEGALAELVALSVVDGTDEADDGFEAPGFAVVNRVSL